MIGEDAIRSILAQYDRYGWKLRRILLSSKLQDQLGSAVPVLFGNAEIIRSEIDAGWFSRASQGQSVAWELRWFNDFPFALLEVINQDTEPNEVKRILRETEDQLKERVKKRSQSH
jgi:hypothetical protein